MLTWLRRLFTGGEALGSKPVEPPADPIVRVRAALTEPDAEMWRTLLVNNGVPAMVKNVGSGFWRMGQPSSFSPDYDLFVRQSDLERAEEILPRDDRGVPLDDDGY